MNEQKFYQEKFFNYLSNKFSSEHVLHETMEVLMLKKGATYKRMNGDTALLTSELVKLSNHFNVSLDNIYQPEKYISCFHPFWKEKATSIDFMDRFSLYMAALMRNEKSHMVYLANELPIFYYFSHRYIFNFSLAIWNHLHWDKDRLQIKEDKEIDFKLETFRKDITKYYASSPVTEIWNSNMLSNLYQQIIFSISIRAFEDIKFVENLIKEIKSLIEQLRQVAFTGSREDDKEEGDLKIYLNEFGNYLNILMYSSESTKISFLGFDIPQFLITYNEHFFNYSTRWVNKIKKRSVLISSDGFQYRELFFMKMETDFKQFEERVDKMIGVYYQ